MVAPTVSLYVKQDFFELRYVCVSMHPEKTTIYIRLFNAFKIQIGNVQRFFYFNRECGIYLYCFESHGPASFEPGRKDIGFVLQNL